jgi:hypothetical protein
MPGRDETTTPGSSQSLNEAACNGTHAAVESGCSTRHSIALLAVLIAACVLVLSPAVVAVISMIDQSALDHTLAWFQLLSPITSQLDHAKLVVAAGSVVMFWSGRQGNKLHASTGA